MKCLKQSLSSLFIIFFAMSLGACSKGGSIQYGELTPFKEGEPIDLPGFTVTYMGDRIEDIPTSPGNSFIFTYHDFEVISKNETEIISWSSGTGNLAPLPFTFDEKEYYLEMMSSLILGTMGHDQFVIWEKVEFDRKIEEKRS